MSVLIVNGSQHIEYSRDILKNIPYFISVFHDQFIDNYLVLDPMLHEEGFLIALRYIEYRLRLVFTKVSIDDFIKFPKIPPTPTDQYMNFNLDLVESFKILHMFDIQHIDELQNRINFTCLEDELLDSLSIYDALEPNIRRAREIKHNYSRINYRLENELSCLLWNRPDLVSLYQLEGLPDVYDYFLERKIEKKLPMAWSDSFSFHKINPDIPYCEYLALVKKNTFFLRGVYMGKEILRLYLEDSFTYEESVDMINEAYHHHRRGREYHLSELKLAKYQRDFPDKAQFCNIL